MAIWRVTAEALCETELTADGLRTTMEANLLLKDVKRADLEVSEEESAWTCVADAEFNREADAVDWMSQFVTEVDARPLVKAASRVARHLCPHPDLEKSYHCSEDLEALYVDTVKA
jgi:hypothetical protein